MTLDEAINHCEEVAQENEKQFSDCPMKYDGAYANNGKTACKCAEEHRQLAEWLKELKQLKALIKPICNVNDARKWYQKGYKDGLHDYEEVTTDADVESNS